MKQNQEEIIQQVQHWLETIVIGLNLCPFAKRELLKNRLHFAISMTTSEDQLLLDLRKELLALKQSGTIVTSLLIHPNVLEDFFLYNQFLDKVDDLLIELELTGIYQIASFHPDYQFADTQATDVSNYTNRSPYPLLHLLAETSVEQAIASYPDVDLIPERNMEVLDNMGLQKILTLFN